MGTEEFASQGGYIALGEGATFHKQLPSISFRVPDGFEMMRLEAGGKAYVRGELVATNKAVYDAFVEWLAAIRAIPLPVGSSTPGQ